MNRWWIRRKYGLPSWLTDGAMDPEPFVGLPVAWESPGGPGEGGGSGGGSGGSGDGGEGTGEGGAGDKKDDEDPAKLRAQIAKLQGDLRTTKATASKVTQLEQQLSTLTDKDKSDLDKANEKVANLERAVEQEKTRRSSALIRAAVDRASRSMKFIDEDAAFALMDRSGIVVKDDDTVEGVEDALKVLATARPHLIKAEEEGEGSGKAPPPTPRREGEKRMEKDPVRDFMDRRYGTKPPPVGARNGSR